MMVAVRGVPLEDGGVCGLCIRGESAFPENALVKALRNLHAKKSHKGNLFFFLPENKLLGQLSKQISSISKVSTTKHLL